jgi:hypothetical protein
MTSINPNATPTSAQLTGIVNSTPMPNVTGTLADGSPFNLSPGNLTLGGATGNAFSIVNGTPQGAAATPAATPAATGGIAVGGGDTALANGAQPPLPPGVGTPGTANTAATTPAVPGTTAASTTTPTSTNLPTIEEPSGSGSAEGFGRANRNATMKVTAGGADFSFPSFNASAKSNEAPAIHWGSGWKRVEVNGMWYMESPAGTKAIPAVEFRMTPKPASKVSTIHVANGWGKKFPDGSIVVFDRTEGAYKLDPKGNKTKLELGTHTIGGVKVRIFEASVVRTLDKAGKVHVFDSRGNTSAGSDRGRLAAAVAAADAGASISGGGKATTDSGPSTDSGGGKVAAGGGTTVDPAALTGNVQRLTGIARGILDEIRGGNVDAAKLASLQSQLNELPAGILQAAGAGGSVPGVLAASTTSSTPATPGAPPAAGTNGDGTPPTVGGGGTTVSASSPVAGVDANAATKNLAAGATAKLAGSVPAAYVGHAVRFGQLPADVQASISTAFGSSRAGGAFTADQVFNISADGSATLVAAGKVFLRDPLGVRGAGPGEDIALTVRPGRQPGDRRPTASDSAIAGGGAATSTSTSAPHVASHSPTGIPSVAGHATSVHAVHATHATHAVTGGGASTTRSIQLFPAGGEMRSEGLGGITGTFTWKTLPAKAKDAILAYLRSNATAAGKAFASRTGAGWSFDPNAVIVVDAGYASFTGGLTMARSAAATSAGGPTSGTGIPPVSGGGPTSNPVGHDATRPPVTGGGAGSGTGVVSPGTPPPTPVVADPGEHSNMTGMAGMPGM